MSEDMELDEALSIKNDIDLGYIFHLPETMILKEKDANKFLKEIEKIGKYKKFNYSSDKNKIYWKLISEKYKFYVLGNTKELKFTLYAINENIANDIWRMYVQYLEEDTNIKIFAENYYIANDRLGSNNKQLNHEDLDYISDLYYPYIQTSTMFDQFFTGAENILLCVGQPGVGKTKLGTLALKYAAKNTDKIPYDKFLQGIGVNFQYINVVFVKGAEVLARDDFWQAMEDDPPDFVIIDDLDYMLTKRSADVQSSDDQIKNKFLNQFLSYTDGVEKYKTKFIITTNQKYDEIDTALLRKGRLFDILELRELTQEEALLIWQENKLDNIVFFKIFQDDCVLSAELGSEISKRLNKRITNACESYLKENNISKLHQAKRSKTISI